MGRYQQLQNHPLQILWIVVNEVKVVKLVDQLPSVALAVDSPCLVVRRINQDVLVLLIAIGVMLVDTLKVEVGIALKVTALVVYEVVKMMLPASH